MEPKEDNDDQDNDQDQNPLEALKEHLRLNIILFSYRKR